jgi:hypothetical protein
MWPSGAVGGEAGAIPVGQQQSPGGSGRGVVQGCPRPGLGGWSGQRRCQRWGAAVAGVGATGAPAPVSSQLWQVNGRRARLYGVLGEALWASVGNGGGE